MALVSRKKKKNQEGEKIKGEENGMDYFSIRSLEFQEQKENHCLIVLAAIQRNELTKTSTCLVSPPSPPPKTQPLS